MVDAVLLEILVCPEDHTTVHEADTPLVDKINTAIQAGTLKNRAGEIVAKAMDAGLIREDGKYLYPVRGGIPVMLIDEAIELAQVEAIS